MIKIIDIDELFDKYISDFVYQNIGKVKPEEIENQIPKLYEEFGDKKLKDLDNFTPNTYYLNFDILELLECLKTHITKCVSVSDFLCEAITKNKENEGALVSALDDKDEEFTLYLMNMLADMGSTKCLDKFLEFILWDYSSPIKELATEHLKGMANDVKGQILSQFNDVDESVKEYLSEILSMCDKEDKIFDILINQFVKNPSKIPIYSGYLSKYGDQRALPFLMTQIEREDITYADFEELRFAIEVLGGEYNKIRDFNKDKTYKKIKKLLDKLKIYGIIDVLFY